MNKFSMKKLLTGICFSVLLVGVISACKNKGNSSEEEKPSVFICEMVNQDTPYCVVLSQNPTETESFAASEIVAYYSMITNQTMEIIDDSQVLLTTTSNYISIGNTRI